MSVRSIPAPSETVRVTKGEPLSCLGREGPWEEARKPKRHHKVQGPRAPGRQGSCELQGQEEKDELGFAAQAGFLESRDARVGTVLLNRRCTYGNHSSARDAGHSCDT